MFRNFFKTAWRSLVNNKAYSLLNIVGLAAGMAVALLIGLWVQYQVSFDQFLPDNKQVYKVGKRVTQDGEKRVSMVTPLPLAEAIKKEVPGVKYVAATDWLRSHGLVVGEKQLYINGAIAGSDFLNIFQYPLLRGDKGQVLQDPYSIVLNETTAAALFGTEDPIGKMVRFDNSHDLKVTGIMKNVPANSTLQFNYVVPLAYSIINNEGFKNAAVNWDQVTSNIYLALDKNVTYKQVQPALEKIFAKYHPREYASDKTETILQPLTDWHLYGEFKNGKRANGFITYVSLFALIGVLVLVIACINFVNLSTARSEKRAKEVGVRKAIGSSRISLIMQFMMEAMLMSFCAFTLSLFIVVIALPAFGKVVDAPIVLPYQSLSFWLIMLGYVLFTGFLAGSRPAFYLSSFKPVKVLKGRLNLGKSAGLPRKTLVTLQFVCSIALIIGTVVVYQQVKHAQNRPSGYDPKALIMTDASKDLKRNYEPLKHDLLASGLVTSVTKSSSPITDNWSFTSMDRWPGQQEDKAFMIATVGVTDKDYFTTMGMQLFKGRGFEGAGDSSNVVVNEEAVRQMGLKEPLNQLITWNGIVQSRIVGVVKNAIMGSPFGDARPMLFAYDPNWANFISYRISPAVSTQEGLQGLAPIFAKYNPAYPYLYKFVDQEYAAKFKSEVLVGKLAAIFAILAVFISCLGLFGLAAFTAEQRTKEIGIRKVLGASVFQLWLMLSEEFMLLVGLSAMIAIPVATWFLKDWLAGYSYRVDLEPGVFVGVTITALVICVATVSFQSIRAALMNPVKSLKEE
jgi:ABC-type antimicrobial peptide transport system permease subunit